MRCHIITRHLVRRVLPARPLPLEPLPSRILRISPKINIKLPRETSCLAAPLQALLHLHVRLLLQIRHILRRKRPSLTFSNPKSAPCLARKNILPVLAVLIKAGAESVRLLPVVDQQVRRRQSMVLLVVASRHGAPLEALAHLLLQRVLFSWITVQKVGLRQYLLTGRLHELGSIASRVRTESVCHALTHRLRCIE